MVADTISNKPIKTLVPTIWHRAKGHAEILFRGFFTLQDKVLWCQRGPRKSPWVACPSELLEDFYLFIFFIFVTRTGNRMAVRDKYLWKETRVREKKEEGAEGKVGREMWRGKEKNGRKV